MKRCIFCGSQIEENEPVCPHCSHDMNENNLTEDDIHFVRQHAFGEVTKGEDKRNGGLTFLVTGGILLIIGVIFLVLSFRYNSKRVRVFTPTSVEFSVCCIALASSLTLLIWGIVKIAQAMKSLKFYRSIIARFDHKK